MGRRSAFAVCLLAPILAAAADEAPEWLPEAAYEELARFVEMAERRAAAPASARGDLTFERPEDINPRRITVFAFVTAPTPSEDATLCAIDDLVGELGGLVEARYYLVLDERSDFDRFTSGYAFPCFQRLEMTPDIGSHYLNWANPSAVPGAVVTAGGQGYRVPLGEVPQVVDRILRQYGVR